MSIPYAIKSLFQKDEHFGIAIFEDSSWDLNDIHKKKEIYRREIGNSLLPKSLMIQADPFLYVMNDTLYLFYESMRNGGKGILKMVHTTDLTHWSLPVTVLVEPWHLSFPFVYNLADGVYMIPESEACNEVRLYKANDDLTSFTFVKTLLKQERTDNIFFNYSDSHVFQKNSVFFLFTSVFYKWEYHLELYYTDDLLQHSLRPHPLSPVCIGNHFGRCGGSLLQTADGLLRVAQDCEQSYGANISLLKILELTPERYTEKLFLQDVFHVKDEPFKDGGHQLHVVNYRGKIIYATDYRKQKWCWYHRLSELTRKLCKAFKSI